MENIFFIKQTDFGKRLDKFLVEKFPQISRAKIQKLIEEEKIFVNGKKSAKHYFIKEGDEIKIFNSIDEFPLKNNDWPPRTILSNSSVPFFVLFESPDYLIIEKPSGVVVHQAEAHQEPDTLANGLAARYPDIFRFKEDDKNLRPGIVHRLDKDVSGIMVVARTGEMFEHLKKQFQERLVKKIYIALVHGKIEREEDEIRFDIARSKEDKRKMASRPETKNDSLSVDIGANMVREAVTYFEVLKHFERYTLLKVQIKTGRTHQIRVHLNAYSHPVVGDEVYRPKNLKTSVRLGRLFLHAHELGFFNLKGDWVEYQSELPKNLQDFLKTIK